MADDGVSNGGVDDQYGAESETKIAVLQRECEELVSENAARKEEINKLTAELDGLRSDGADKSDKIEELQRELVQSRDAAKTTEVIAARAADLETEVARLHHDMVSEMTAAEEARADAAELRKVKADSEARVRDLERKIGVLETKEIEERNKRIRFEEEMRDKIAEKEREFKGFRQKIEEELEESVKQKLRLEEALRESEKKVTGLESSILQLREEAKEAERVIISLNEKASQTIDKGLNGVHGDGKGSKLQWPVVAAGSTGAVVATAAVIYLCYGKRS